MKTNKPRITSDFAAQKQPQQERRDVRNRPDADYYAESWKKVQADLKALSAMFSPDKNAAFEPRECVSVLGIPPQGDFLVLRVPSFPQRLLPVAAGVVAGLVIARLLRLKEVA